MSMLDDPWRMAIPNPDEVLNGAFAIDGSLSVRGIYADEIRLRKGATYSDFLTSVGTLDDYGDLTAIIKGLWGVTTETGVDWNIIRGRPTGRREARVQRTRAHRGPLRHIYWSRQALRAWSPSSTGATGRSFFAWFDHFKVNIRALSADRTGETPETTGGAASNGARRAPDRSDWAKTQNWALKDHFHDERYALVKHPHVKADITDWAHRHLYDDIIGGPKQRLGWRRLRREGMDKREYYKLENEKKQWSELKDKEMTEVAEKKAEANKLMTDAQRQEESASPR
eukprot:tig00021290_g19989.t1